MVAHVDVKPRCEGERICGNVARQVGGGYPSGCLHFIWVGGDVQVVGCEGKIDVDDFVFDHAATYIGAVFQLAAVGACQASYAQFVIKASQRTCSGIFAPVGVCAAGVRPEIWRVVFVGSALLQQDTSLVHDKDADRFVSQPVGVCVQFFDGG